jgi:hypothetical protein
MRRVRYAEWAFFIFHGSTCIGLPQMVIFTRIHTNNFILAAMACGFWTHSVWAGSFMGRGSSASFSTESTRDGLMWVVDAHRLIAHFFMAIVIFLGSESTRGSLCTHMPGVG